jgi:hypothetical protein
MVTVSDADITGHVSYDEQVDLLQGDLTRASADSCSKSPGRAQKVLEFEPLSLTVTVAALLHEQDEVLAQPKTNNSLHAKCVETPP